MAHVIIAEAWICYHTSSFGICGGQSDTGTGFCPEYFKFTSSALFLQNSLLIHASVINSV